jgi:ABC-type multidrug transport system permease subunit
MNIIWGKQCKVNTVYPTVPSVDQKILTLPEHMISHVICVIVSVASSVFRLFRFTFNFALFSPYNIHIDLPVYTESLSRVVL